MNRILWPAPRGSVSLVFILKRRGQNSAFLSVPPLAGCTAMEPPNFQPFCLVFQYNYRHFCHPQLLLGEQPGVTGDYDVIRPYQRFTNPNSVIEAATCAI